MKVLVTGAAGHLGAAIVQEFETGSHDVAGFAHRDLDITNGEAVAAAIAREAPDVVVNCAAYNEVDAAEDDPVRAFEMNAFAVLTLARNASERGAAFVHYGSDFVFDGRADRPYTEEDRPNPASAYGLSKLLGERLAADARRWFVLRIESVFGGPTAGRGARLGSAGTLIASIEAGDEVPVFTDRVVSPSYARDVASATRRLVESTAAPGLYHCVNSECRWDEFAREAARLLGREARLRPITLDTVALRAARPRYSVLSTKKLERAGIIMPSWQDALRRCIEGRRGLASTTAR
jgi:dTDP-4-dehydrorhamnose reductase